MAALKRVIVSVSNDIVTDQRVNKSCLALRKCGFEVVFVGRRRRESPPMDKRPYRCRRLRLLFGKGPMFYAEFNVRLFFFLLFHRASCLLSNDLDTILPNFWVARLKRIPMIYDSHEYFTETPELVRRPKVQRVWRKIEEYVLPHLREMITVNESIAGLFRDKYKLTVHSVRNIPPRSALPEPATRAGLHLPDNRHLLVLQGSGINVQRGAEELVEAMRYLDDCLLMIVGGGDVLPRLKRQVQDRHWEDRVRFFPRMPYQKMMALTQLAELGLAIDKDTNLNYHFSLPNKLFDYIQAGVPVVSSHLPEIEGIVNDYDIGTFIADHRPETIAKTVRDALSNRERYAKWQENLKAASRELCWENEEKKLMAVYAKYC